MNRSRRNALARRGRRRQALDLEKRVEGLERLAAGTILRARARVLSDGVGRALPGLLGGDYAQAVEDVAAETIRPAPDGRY